MQFNKDTEPIQTHEEYISEDGNFRLMHFHNPQNGVRYVITVYGVDIVPGTASGGTILEAMERSKIKLEEAIVKIQRRIKDLDSAIAEEKAKVE